MPTPDAARAVFGDRVALAERYVEILATRGVEWGLIGPREADRLWDRHVLNSVAVAHEIPHGATVCDVGSGAGLPGIPLALAREDLAVTLLEPLLRRATFLTEVVEELALSNPMRVVRARAEDHLERYDVVTCRAVAPLERLFGWTAPLFLPAGTLVALKGSSARDELRAAGKALHRSRVQGRVVEVAPYEGAEVTHLIVVERP